MRRWHHALFLSALMLGFGAQNADAQIGAILDWVIRLSGPGVARVGLQYVAPLGGGEYAPEVSFAGTYGFKVADGDGPDGDASLAMWSAQGTLGQPVKVFSSGVAIIASGGVAIHAFSGDDFDSFTAFSIPLQAIVRIPAGNSLSFRLGGGVNVFRFSDDAFDPLDIGVDQGAWDPSPAVQASVTFEF